MNILILTDGKINYGGYSTIAKKIYNNIKTYFKCNLKTLIFSERYSCTKNTYELYINDNIHYIINNIHNSTIISNIFKKYIEKEKYDLIICCSPWSFLISNSLFENTNILYIKGGGIIFENVNDTYIYKLDNLTLKIENFNFENLNNKIKILPTTDLISDVIKNNSICDKFKFISPIQLSYFNLQDYKIITNNKEYDLIVVISDHNRKIKNSEFCFKIYSLFPELNKLVIGKNCEFFNTLKNTIVINEILDNQDILKYYSKSKITLIPSFFDAGPSTSIEAVLNNCIPIIYKMCGFSNFYSIKVNTLDINEWIYLIKNTLETYNYEIINKNKIKCINEIEKDINLFVETIKTF